jgi:toxin CcdB
MARFDLHRARDGYLLDVQSNLITNVGTRLVVPMFPTGSVPRVLTKLHPVFEIDGEPHLMATHLMGAVPAPDLGPVVGSLDRHYDRIVAAIDMIFLGF